MRRFSFLALMLAGSLGAVLWGCNASTPPGPGYVGKSLAALQAAGSCDDVLAQLKQKTQSDMESALQQNLQQALQMRQYGCGGPWYGEGDATTGAPGGAVPPAANGGGKSSDSASEYSTTNNQESGVDEADFIKNDGAFIYIVADGRFQVLDSWPAPETRVIGSAAIEGTPTKIFVTGDRAVVYSQLGPLVQSNTGGGYYGSYSPGECTYGYDCEFTGDGQILKVTVFDITDRASPVLLREMVFSGSYLNSRRIDNIVHTVVVFPEVTVPGLVYWPSEMNDYWSLCGATGEYPFSEQQIVDMFVTLWQANSAAIQAASITQFIPGVKDTRHVGAETIVEEGLLSDCANFYVSQAGDGRSFLSLVSFDMAAQDAIGIATIVGKPGAVYASTDALYIADRHYASDMSVWYYEPAEQIEEATTVHKFLLNRGAIGTAYAGSGVVKGRVLNQFSLDEQDGYLRIATTTGHLPDPNAHSTVAVMAQGQGELNIVGLVDHIAPSEDIRSARFEGKLGFLVTFKKTDPLFVLDLSDPTNPAVKGELQIPGFSTYMHMMDDTHILSIGFDAQDMGDFAWFAGVQLQIFDVTEVTSPRLLWKEVIGTRGSSTEAATNHLAFNYFAAKNLLAIPMVKCVGGSGGNYGDELVFSGLMVYRVTLDAGFQYLGGIPHAAPQTNTPYGTSCGTWWADSTSTVKRSIIADDYVYSVAETEIKVANLADLANPVADVDLAP
ncbi:MAG TPA: beta-propeller domain-containing protein [Polyangia bacterium]|jgi:hypothetical protein